MTPTQSMALYSLFLFLTLSLHSMATKEIEGGWHITTAEPDWGIVVVDDWEQIITRPKKSLRCDRVR